MGKIYLYKGVRGFLREELYNSNMFTLVEIERCLGLV